MDKIEETILLKSIDNYVSDMPRAVLEYHERELLVQHYSEANLEEINEFIKENQFNPF